MSQRNQLRKRRRYYMRKMGFSYFLPGDMSLMRRVWFRTQEYAAKLGLGYL